MHVMKVASLHIEALKNKGSDFKYKDIEDKDIKTI